MPLEHLHPTVREYVASRTLAETYDEYFASNLLFRYDCRFLDEYLSPPGPVLDLGCGTGRHLLHLERCGISAVGLDLNPHMLQEAWTTLRQERVPCRLLRGDFHSLPLRRGARFQGILLMFSTLGLVRPARQRR